MTTYEQVLSELHTNPRRWLVTGSAGFIGSNLVEALLAANQTVVGLDCFSTGKRSNLPDRSEIDAGPARERYTFIEGDVRSMKLCRQACTGVDYVLHQAAQVSVPASMANPMETHETNVTGFLNILVTAREARVRRVVYASSCSIYGDSVSLPLTEDQPGRPLSPYAASKLADEVYAATFANGGGPSSVGLRYFNVFGPRQDPKGVYAAVIPQWVTAMIQRLPIRIYGDGSTTRDFCFVANVVQANLLAATAELGAIQHDVFNVAVNACTSLKELFEYLRLQLLPDHPHLQDSRPIFEDFRPGDIRHSQADISKAKRILGYAPTHTVERGLQETLSWYKKCAPC
jgi:UDP-N-acetylglucosamine 4-epimerase